MRRFFKIEVLNSKPQLKFFFFHKFSSKKIFLIKIISNNTKHHLIDHQRASRSSIDSSVNESFFDFISPHANCARLLFFFLLINFNYQKSSTFTWTISNHITHHQHDNLCSSKIYKNYYYNFWYSSKADKSLVGVVEVRASIFTSNHLPNVHAVHV